MTAAAVQLVGDFASDQQLMAQNFKREQAVFQAKFEQARRFKEAPAATTVKGVQISEILGKLAQEVYRPDNISYATYERMLRNSEVNAAYRIVLNSTTSRGWEINGGDDELRIWYERMYKCMPMTQVFEQGPLSAFAYGHNVTEKRFGRRKARIEMPITEEQKALGIDTQPDEETYIEEYAPLAPWTITYWPHASGRMGWVRQYTGLTQFGSPTNFDASFNRFGTLVDRRVTNVRAVPINFNPMQFSPSAEFPIDAFWDFKPSKINHFVFQGKFGDPYGESGLKAAYTDFVILEHLVGFQAEYMQNMAGGQVIGTAGMGQVDEMRDELVKMQSSGVAAVPEGSDIKIYWAPQTNSPFMDAIRYHSEQIMKAMLVPVLIMGQKTQFGSRSLGETHFELFKLIRIQKMQNDLKRWVQNDIAQLGWWNWGIADPLELPQFTFKAWSTVELEQLTNMIKKAAEIGVIGQNDIGWIRELFEMPGIGEEGLGELFPVAQDNEPGPDEQPKVGGRAEAQRRRKKGDTKPKGSKGILAYDDGMQSNGDGMSLANWGAM